MKLILAYTDSLQWNDSYTDDVLNYLEEAIDICKTSDCGETLISVKALKLDFALAKGDIEGLLPQLEALLSDPLIQSPRLKSYIHQLLGMYFLMTGYSENEFNHFLEGIRILEENAPSEKRLGILYQYAATMYSYKSLPDSCFYFGHKALQHFKMRKDTLQLISIYVSFNNWHLSVGETKEAFKNIFKAKELNQKFEIQDTKYFNIIVAMGFSHFKRKEYTKAITTAEDAIERILEGTTMNDEERAIALWNLYLVKGRSLMPSKRAEEGLLFIQKSIAVFQDNDLFPGLVLYTKLYEIEAQLKLENYRIARSSINAFITNFDNNPSYEIYNIKIIDLLTELYKSSKTKPTEIETSISKKIIKRVIDKNIGKNNSDLLIAYELTALLQLNENRKAEAIVSYDKINEIKDSIWAHKKTEAIDKLLISYQSKEQKHEIILQKERLKEADVQENLLIALLFVLFLLVLVAFLIFLQRKWHVADLEQKVMERTHDLEIINKELANSNEELERFAYISSHDLKEPLRNIISFIGLLETKINNNADVLSYFKFIKESSIHMSRLIEGVLAFSLLKKTEIAKKDVEVAHTINKVQSSILQLVNEKQVQIKIGKLPVVKTDASMLYMVFKNLIENAIKYNQNDSPIIEINYTKDENFYWFSVSDNGIGIEEEYFDQIFEMFKRLHNKKEYAGTGIGLAICKRIVGYLGGEIKVESVLREGSTFKFSVPVE